MFEVKQKEPILRLAQSTENDIIRHKDNHAPTEIKKERIKLKYDGFIPIATARRVNARTWENQNRKWSVVLNFIKDPYRTKETQLEFNALTPERQTEIKGSRGGFVPAILLDGKRNKESVSARQAITLDADNAGQFIFSDLCLLYGCAVAVHSTHKHTSEHQRIRVIMPMKRPVTPDEYRSLVRKITRDLGPEQFDDTDCEHERLMFWPTTSKDGEYLFEYNDAPWLDPDEILSHCTQSKKQEREDASNEIAKEIKKQEDPLTKPGVIGAFCRAYTIDEAIETFLSDIYEACDVDNRYTFREGSTAAGLVVYDDKYAYSHHGTDPASGKLCNAFDLVRLHLFSKKDIGAKENTPPHKLPSFLSMEELAVKDKKTLGQLDADKRQELLSDFIEPEEETARTELRQELERDRKGNILGTANNYLIILQNDPRLNGFAQNEFLNTKDILSPVPWREKKDLGHWRDSDTANLYIYLEKEYGVTNEANMRRALKAVFDKGKYHPVRDYLNSLHWDKDPRAETVFIDYLGADDNGYVRAVTRKSLTAAAARIMDPGIKWDYVPIIVGAQGIGKSVILQKLGRLDKGWFSDNFYLRGTKEDVEQILGVWIMEIPELAGLSKRDVDEIKSYVTRREDQVRLAFQEEKGYFKRQCVFFGTTNNDYFLKDVTGNRRFWPIRTNIEKKTKDLFKDLTEQEIDQIWAEVMVLYKKGEPLFLADGILNAALEAQDAHSEVDDRTGIIQEYLDTPLPDNWSEMEVNERRAFIKGGDLAPKGTIQRNTVSIVEIWTECFAKNQADLTRKESLEISEIMTKLNGWERGKQPVTLKIYGSQRVFRRTH